MQKLWWCKNIEMALFIALALMVAASKVWKGEARESTLKEQLGCRLICFAFAHALLGLRVSEEKRKGCVTWIGFAGVVEEIKWGFHSRQIKKGGGGYKFSLWSQFNCSFFLRLLESGQDHLSLEASLGDKKNIFIIPDADNSLNIPSCPALLLLWSFNFSLGYQLSCSSYL